MNEDSMLIVECRYCSCYFEIYLRNDDDRINYCPNCGENLEEGYSAEEDDQYEESEDLWQD
jgi:hypothetical protein